MNLDNAKNAQADILRKVLGFRDAAVSYSLDEEDYPLLAPQYEERILGEKFAPDDERLRLLKTRWDQRALIGVGIRPPPNESKQSAFAITIFCQRKALASSSYVQNALKLAGGEAQVVVTGPVGSPQPASLPRARGPLRIGDSVGHPSISAGTLGCFANDANDIGAISNAHVLAPAPNAKLGDNSLAPGVRDGGRDPASAFGRLLRAAPIDYAPTGMNQVDCAWSRINNGVGIDRFTLKGAGPRGRNEQLKQTPIAVLARDRVGKIGRTTGLTWGDVSAINTTVSVRTRIPGGWLRAAYSGQLAVTAPGRAFSQGGDSGSILFTDQFDPAGLVFAGSSAPEGGEFVTYANPISLVLAALSVSL